jgi:hypothetical protein
MGKTFKAVAGTLGYVSLLAVLMSIFVIGCGPGGTHPSTSSTTKKEEMK